MNTSIVRHLGLVTLLVGLASLAHADAPSGRFTVTSGAVYDNKTKLTWLQSVPSTKSCWECAKNYCASLGGPGWHLPTIKELLTIVDYSRSNPAVDPTAFPSTPADYFWSSTPGAKAAGTSWPTAWAVNFSAGIARTAETTVTPAPEYYVRCVH